VDTHGSVLATLRAAKVANPDNVVFPLQGMGKATRIEKQGAGEIADTDAALVFVSADVNVETNPRLHSKVSHPWLTVPTQYSPFVDGWAEAAGFNGAALTTRVRAPALDVNGLGALWVAAVPELVKGNSGGPLYTFVNGERRVFGVAGEYDPNHGEAPNVWWSSASGPAAAWLQDKARDTEHSAFWKRWHRRMGNEWLGDADYTGPCNAARDSDCDLWYDENDNCPSAFNYDQEDQDEDGVGDRCDNCRKVKNPFQANCNESAERAMMSRSNQGGAELHPVLDSSLGPLAREVAYVRGDQCDPVPCAATLDEKDLVDTSCVTVGDHQECTSRRRMSTFRTTTVGSYAMEPAGGIPQVTVVPNVETHFRFCQSAVVPNYDVDCASSGLMRNQYISKIEAPLDPDAPWHRIRFGNPPVGTTRVWDYGVTSNVARWRYEDDIASWFGGGTAGIQLPNGCDPSNRAACLAGVFWIHAQTEVGRVERKLDNASNRFIGAKPEHGIIAYCPLAPEGIVVYDPAPSGNPAPGTEIVTGNRARVGWVPGRIGEDPRPSVLAVALSGTAVADYGHLASLNDNGFVMPLAPSGAANANPNCGESFVDPMLESTFEAVRWSSNVDPDLWHRPPSRLLAVGLDSGGRLHAIVPSEEKLEHLAPGWGELIELPGEDPVGIVDPTIIDSGVARGLFLLGGTDGLTSLPSSDIWFHSLPGAWRRLAARLDGESVLAATYSFADDHLWALVAPPDPAYPWELVRIDPFGETKEAVYRFASRGGARPILSVARDGAVIVSMTRTLDTRQAIFWANDGSIHAQRLAAIGGKLHRPLIVDEHEVAEVLETATGLQVSRVPDIARVGAVETCPCDNTFGELL